MQTVLPFLELRLFFRDREPQKPFPVTVDELAGIWHCTPRYVKLIVRALCEQGWIDWQPGRGRGNKSKLTLVLDSDELLLEEVRRRTEQGEVHEAMELMNRFGGPAVKDRFMDWISEGIGFSTAGVPDFPQETLCMPVFRSITTLDPGLVYYAFDCHMARQLFNTLVEYDEEQRHVIPCIAHSWESSEDAREWTFYLRKNVLFHHGRELTAEDVMFTLNRLRHDPGRYDSGWMFRDIEQMDAPDRKTVVIRLREPNYLFLKFLCTIAAAIVPEDVVRRDEAAFAEMPVGTGPFRVECRNQGRCVLEAFPAHFRGRAHLDRVEVLIFPPEESGRLKEPDWTSIMTSHGETSGARREALVSGEGGWRNMETIFNCSSMLVFNQRKKGPHNHPLFREALHHIIDREALIADLKGERLCPAQGFHPQEDMGKRAGTYYPVKRRFEIETLLEQSGYAGEVLELVTYSHHEEDACWIQARARTFGVYIEIRVRNAEEWSDRASLQRYDCQLYGIVLGGDEVRELEVYLQNNFFAALWDSATEEVVRRETAAILREPVEAARKERFAGLERWVRQTHAVMFLVHKTTNTAFHQSVRGVKINSYGWVDFYHIWFNTGAAVST
ncbi:SgrR family transcriptional regulator [Paenibacillus chitinolyticus]|uniref:SgrR family transcriptional regulator n=1 Tax=Paenibacillus chitinolyticus TaxID=79263 RepID=A0A410WZ20_9BACL|nr:SgrR family transcriptional regulator [Paenibacillus chitinolyticus]MCY9590356.1 SgrR family transcriptional regulator [Paenibacillus chitinolyticus]MCY9596650.1 SgrR family transcriptional regulator [Paenibacillus chitinolyticus]QAV19654.1 SgrR family transcriptional regulator [Paenibacillus chitinolyticus]